VHAHWDVGMGMGMGTQSRWPMRSMIEVIWGTKRVRWSDDLALGDQKAHVRAVSPRDAESGGKVDMAARTTFGPHATADEW
jgi:hypothetical protein